jgi:NitT/TauT family transport system permease protein
MADATRVGQDVSATTGEPGVIAPGATATDRAREVEVQLAMQRSHRTRKVRELRTTILVMLLRVAAVVAVVALWEGLSRAGVANALFFSRPSLVLDMFFQNWRDFAEQTLYTLEAVLVGFTLSSLAGILLGMLLARFHTLARVTQPFVVFVNSLPRIALVSLFILWFGITFQAKVATSFMLVFFIVLLNTQVGLATVDRELLLVTRLLGGSGRQIYLKVALPAALPAIFGGLRLGVSYSILGVVGSEMIASRNGLGQLIALYAENLQAAGVFAALILLGALAAVVSGLLALAEKRLSRWRDTSH